MLVKKLKKIYYTASAWTVILFVNLLFARESLAQVRAEVHKTWWDAFFVRAALIGGYQDPSGYTTTASVIEIVASVVAIVLGLVGSVFIVLMIYGGFLWLTARGNKEQVEKATKIIRDSIAGAAIIIGAYVITYFITKALTFSIEGRRF